jgi:hypothetical protein
VIHVERSADPIHASRALFGLPLYTDRSAAASMIAMIQKDKPMSIRSPSTKQSTAQLKSEHTRRLVRDNHEQIFDPPVDAIDHGCIVKILLRGDVSEVSGPVRDQVPCS